jgi:hypothetical protein
MTGLNTFFERIEALSTMGLVVFFGFVVIALLVMRFVTKKLGIKSGFNPEAGPADYD